MTFPIPDVIDYTSRDFESIRDDLINLIPLFSSDWLSRSTNDFGIILLELWAYVGDLNNYYADRVANESFLDTATQRSSIIRIARMLGYIPTGAIAASTLLTFTNASTTAYTIPAGTKVTTSTDAANDLPITFETNTSVLVPPLVEGVAGTASVGSTEGTTTTDLPYTADGTADQSFDLFNSGVIQGSVSVVVTVGSVSTTWTYFPQLLAAGPFDNAYTLLVDDNDIVTVLFGNGASGFIPPNGSTITTTYRLGGGVEGNVAAFTLDVLTDGTIPTTVTVNNPSAAVGGVDEESTASIQQNAPSAFRTLQRAVTLTDYADLAVQVVIPGASVARASAVMGVPTSVTVYIAPAGGGGYSTGTTPTTVFAALMAATDVALTAASPAPTSVTILGPAYVPIDIVVALTVAPTASQANAVNDATNALNDLLSFDNVIFGDTITPADVYAAIQPISGVIYPSLTDLFKHSGSPGVGVISLAANEYPVPGTITVTATGGV